MKYKKDFRTSFDWATTHLQSGMMGRRSRNQHSAKSWMPKSVPNDPDQMDGDFLETTNFWTMRRRWRGL